MSEVNNNGSGYPFDAAELDFAAGGYSINALAGKYGIPEATLRRYSKANGWVKGASETKRKMVREALAGDSLDEGVTNDPANFEAVRQTRLAEAAQDVEDMNAGLKVARACIVKLLAMVESIDNPNDVKRVVEANRAAVETIRKIRSLDEAPPPEAAVTVTVGDDDLDELRAAFKRRLEAPVGAPEGG